MGVSKLDLHPGGVFHYSMQSPDGHEMWGKFVFAGTFDQLDEYLAKA